MMYTLSTDQTPLCLDCCLSSSNMLKKLKIYTTSSG